MSFSANAFKSCEFEQQTSTFSSYIKPLYRFHTAVLLLNLPKLCFSIGHYSFIKKPSLCYKIHGWTDISYFENSGWRFCWCAGQQIPIKPFILGTLKSLRSLFLLLSTWSISLNAHVMTSYLLTKSPCMHMHMKILEQVLLVLKKLHWTSVQTWTEHPQVQCHICLYHTAAGHALE